MNEIATQGPQIDDSAEKVISQAVSALMNIFPGYRAALKTQDDVDGYKKQMTKALLEANVTSVALLQNGMKMARQQQTDFLPSTGKFVAWCLDGQEKPKPQPALPMLATEMTAEQKQAASERLKKILGE